MGQKFESINEEHTGFIKKQKMYFVATAPVGGRINLSPKGLDTFRIMDGNRVAWLNLTGSGNETAAHLLEDDRITVMFNSFDDEPLILRLYGRAVSVYPDEPEWEILAAEFPGYPGARQIIDMRVEMVHTSCGFGVPLYEFRGHRETLVSWIEMKGEDGIKKYREEKNSVSMDGKKTR